MEIKTITHSNFTTYLYSEVYNSEWEVLELILENKIAELKKQHFLTNQ